MSDSKTTLENAWKLNKDNELKRMKIFIKYLIKEI
jgi:hypothetical protein